MSVNYEFDEVAFWIKHAFFEGFDEGAMEGQAELSYKAKETAWNLSYARGLYISIFKTNSDGILKSYVVKGTNERGIKSTHRFNAFSVEHAATDIMILWNGGFRIDDIRIEGVDSQ